MVVGGMSVCQKWQHFVNSFDLGNLWKSMKYFGVDTQHLQLKQKFCSKILSTSRQLLFAWSSSLISYIGAHRTHTVQYAEDTQNVML